jgi:citrate/tricarballylate utilization protein
MLNPLQTHPTEALREADRLMTVCNACRYCEGLCAVFPAMEMRRSFSSGDLTYLANLCHECGACFYDCQYAPPHEFEVNVPVAMSKLRTESYRDFVWPQAFAPIFERNGVAVALITAISLAAFFIGMAAVHDASALFGTHTGPGAFYVLIPHNVMVAIFGITFLYAIAAIALGVRRFWRETGASALGRATLADLVQALDDAARLRNLHGGGPGCMSEDERPNDRRRLWHHFAFYGFLLCFASTSAASFYHYVFGWIAPYSWYSLPVILGTVGGVGIVVGPAGLLWDRRARDPQITDEARSGMDTGFTILLLLTGVTGLLLLFLRATPAMGTLLAVHLGVVLALFLTLPYGKFVHGAYRFAALVRYAMERRLKTPVAD